MIEIVPVAAAGGSQVAAEFFPSVMIADTPSNAFLGHSGASVFIAQPRFSPAQPLCRLFPQAFVSAWIQMTAACFELTSLHKYMKSCRIFGVNEAADKIGQHQSFVRRAIRSGLLKTVAGLDRLMISELELERFVHTVEDYRPRHRPGQKLGEAAK
jgi:hypothetical protein